METLAPAPQRGQVLLYMVASLSLALNLVDGVSSSCTPTIDMAGQQKFDRPPGQPLILKCRVQLCHSGLPNVTWCKINESSCDAVRTREGISSSMEQQKQVVYILKFESVKINDTGHYRCKAVDGKQSIVSSTIQITISAEFVAENLTVVNITQTGNATDISNQFQTFTLLLYVISSLGGICLLIIIMSLLIYYQKHLKVKHKSSSQDPAPTEELQFVTLSDMSKNCPQYMKEGIPTPTDMDPIKVTVEITYDNAQMGYKSTAQNVPHHEEEDSIVYADLNHNGKKSSFQFVDDSEVEYATVHLN